MDWEDMKKKRCHRNDFKAMVTRYKRTKSSAVGIHNEVLMEPEWKNAGRPMRSIVEMAALRI